MTYYHLRYNVYAHAGAAVEKERWVTFEFPLDDSQIRQQLEREHHQPVSIILSKVICREEFELTRNTAY
jgi:hypothetical protein